MKKTLFALLLCSFAHVLVAQSSKDCSVERFRRLMKEADDLTFGKSPDYQLSVNKLLSAKTCQPDSEAVVNRVLIRVFDEVNRQRTEAVRQKGIAQKQTDKAQAEARRIYANDLAFKSTIALRDGDRTTAYRLAEFAHQYVDDDNLEVTRALVEALYYNDNLTHRPCPWAMNTLVGHASSVLSVSFSPDGKLLATGSEDNTAKIWDLESGKSALTLEGHTNNVNSVAFSPDGKLLATGSNDNTAKIWDLETGNSTLTLKAPVRSVAFSPDGKRLATAGDNTKIWDLETGKARFTLEGHSSGVTSVAFSPGGKRLATGSADNTVKIWDLKSAKAALTLECHSDRVWSVAFSPDGKSLVTGSGDKTTKIWEFTPQGWMERGGREKCLATLILPQLTANNLEPLLDQLPDNEAKLIATREVWQIAAFADLYAEKLIKGLPRRADYERAKRLYQACLDDQHIDDAYFQKKLADLERVWKEKGE